MKERPWQPVLLLMKFSMKFSSLLLFAAIALGCAASPRSGDAQRSSSPATDTRSAAAVRDRLAEVVSLRTAVAALGEEQLTLERGRSTMLQLARAQMCFSLRAAKPEVAGHTVEMLERYTASHEPGEMTKRTRRRIKSAIRDAETAQSGDRTVGVVRCRPSGPAYRGAPPYAGSIKNSWGIDVYRSFSGGPRAGPRVPGGVIR